MTGALETLSAALSCSEEMLDCARAQRWEDLPDIERRRARLLAEHERHAAGADTTRDTGAEAALVARVIATNDAIVDLCELHRQALAGELSGSRRQRRAADAYSATRSR